MSAIDDAAAWLQAWRACGARRPDAALRDALMASYQEPQRAYHTLEHLGECLALLPRLEGAAERPAEVALALWFHDAVYGIGRADNEAQSGAWARAAAWAAACTDGVAERLHALVLATRHGAPPQGTDEQVLVDIDLAILGAAPERFDAYERQVRIEYAAVPEADFRRGRSRFLQGLLARPRLYHTNDAARLFETRARRNLARSIAQLEAR